MLKVQFVGGWAEVWKSGQRLPLKKPNNQEEWIPVIHESMDEKKFYHLLEILNKLIKLNFGINITTYLFYPEK